jgi:predicted HTH domain antitoxin
MSSVLQLKYPATLPDFLQESKVAFEQEAKMALAVKLYELKRIPSGIAAELVGMDRVSFILKLADYQTPMMQVDEDELLQDVNNA